MKILMMGMTCNQGGKETYIMGIYRKLCKCGVTIDFISTDESIVYQEEILNNGSKIYYVGNRNKNFFEFLDNLKSVISREYDVIWSHKTSLSSIEELIIAKQKKVPIRIVHSHCTENMGGKFTALMHAINRRFIGRVCTDFFACSDKAGEYFFDKEEDIRVLKNAFEVEKFKYNYENDMNYRKIFSLDDADIILHVGRFSPEKNHKKIIDVFEKIIKKDDKAHLILCGSGETRKDIEKMIEEYKISSRVIILENRDDINMIQQMADVFIFPSIHEGLPYALLEAQAAGTPCVISSNISDEAIFSKAVSKMDLSANDEKWAEECLKYVNYDKENNKNTLKENGFDLAIEAKKIMSYLSNRIESEKSI